MTMASQPQPLPAIANPLLASESLMRPVSGLLLTTANFADVVSGLPTSGLKAKTRGASGASGSIVRRAFVQQQPHTQSAAADELAQNRVVQRHMLGGAGGNIDPKIAAVVTEGHRFPYPPASAERISTQSCSPSGVPGSLTNRSPFRFATNAGVQPVHADELAQRWNPRRQGAQQLPQRIRLHFQVGDAGTLAWNAEKLNLHKCERLPYK